MELSPGMILEGTVRSITAFGAFIQLPDGRSGLVHISEIANTYVSDIHKHLSEGQAVQVKVLSVDPNGRIALSVKQAAAPVKPAAAEPSQPAPLSFEDKLTRFMADSSDKISGVRQYEHRTRSRKR